MKKSDNSVKRVTSVKNGKSAKVAAGASDRENGSKMIYENQVVEMVSVDFLAGSPLNRRFATSGPEWEDFLDSVHEMGGVVVPLTVRMVEDEEGGKFGEILAGHRRHAAAVECGVAKVPVLWVTMDDAAALAFLVNENLQRLNLSPVDEARLVRAMREEMQITDEEIGRKISRSIGWVRTRQMMLDLGDEVLEAVRSSDLDRHLTLASVEEILRVPEEWREDAVQLVLHPSFQIQPLLPSQAREVLQDCLVRPKAAAAAWAGAQKKVAEEWRKRLKKEMPKDVAENLQCIPVAYEDRARELRGMAVAEEKIPLGMCTASAPSGLTWAWLAAVHGLAVRIVPEECGEKSEAVVNVGLLRLAEETALEHGGNPWLLVKKGGVEKDARDERISKAVAEMDGEGGDDVEDDEEVAVKIEQKMEWHGTIDLGAVRRVAMWAIDEKADPMNAPDYVPNWAKAMALEGMWNQIDEVVNWVMGLRVSQAKPPAAPITNKGEKKNSFVPGGLCEKEIEAMLLTVAKNPKVMEEEMDKLQLSYGERVIEGVLNIAKEMGAPTWAITKIRERMIEIDPTWDEMN